MGANDLMAALGEGPARLSAGDVAASQRRRMLAAMVTAVAEKGYVSVVVADITKRARVSRATFYEQFTDKADCFLAAFHACVDQLVGTLREPDEGPSPGRTARGRLRALIADYLDGLAAFPEGARVCLIELYAVGPDGVAHRRQAQVAFAGLMRSMYQGLAEEGEPVRPLTDFDFEAIVGAISSIATNLVGTGRAAELPGYVTPLVTFVLHHFGLDADSPDAPPAGAPAPGDGSARSDGPGTGS